MFSWYLTICLCLSFLVFTVMVKKIVYDYSLVVLWFYLRRFSRIWVGVSSISAVVAYDFVGVGEVRFLFNVIRWALVVWFVVGEFWVKFAGKDGSWFCSGSCVAVGGHFKWSSMAIRSPCVASLESSCDSLSERRIPVFFEAFWLLVF